MNTRTFLKLGVILAVLFMATASVFAQGLSTVYVDVTNGSDSYTGANATNSPAGTGPKATINGGLAALADAGKLVVVAGDYNGADGAGAAVDINATSFTTGLTIELRQLNGTQIVNVTTGNFTLNIPGGTLTITSTSGTESMNIAGTLTLGNTTNSSTIAMATSSLLKMTASTATITMNNSSQFTTAAPTIGSSTSTVNVTYAGTGSISAGPEAAYSTFGNGSITVNKSSGSVTFPANLSFPGTTGNAISVIGGDATFNGTVTLGRVGSSSSTNSPTAPDINAQNTSNVTFNKAVTLYNAAGGTVGQIKAANSANITFNDAVLWNSAYNMTAGGTNTGGASSMVYNAGTGTISFASTFTLSNATTTSSNSSTSGSTATTYPFNAKITNASTGIITIAQAVANTTKTDANSNVFTYTIDVVNSAAGTVTFSSAIVNNLTNSGTSATMNLNGATSVAAIVTNGASANINGGSYVLTIKTAGTTTSPTTHVTNGGTITTTGGVTISGGVMTFNGGTFPNMTQSGGTVSLITNPVTTGAYNLTGGTLNTNIATTINGNVGIASGTVNANAATTVSGTTTVTTGTLLVADAQKYVTVGMTQSGGTVKYGGNKVASITLGAGGAGFTAVPSVTVTNAAGDPGSGLVVTPVLTATTVANIGMTNPGSGYTDAPTIVFTGGGAGTQATATATLTPTSVASVTVLTAGVGYTSTPTVTFSAPGAGVTATGFATVDLVAGTVTGITVTNPGSGYTAAPTITLGAAGQSTAATTVVKLTATTVASVALTGVGVGYTGTPTITIATPANQSGSGLAVSYAFTPVAVASYTVTAAGANYLVAPTLAVTGGGGSGATATAVLAAITGTLEVDGDLARTAGTFSALSGSKVDFKGTGAQSINGGQLFQADQITFANTSGVITLNASVRALTKVTISAGTNVALGTYNIILSQAGGVIDNSGSYTATGGGGVVMGGSNTVAGGGVGASTIQASPTGVFSNIIIDPGNTGGPYVVTVSNASGSTIRFNGVLTLRSGSLNVASGDFGPTGTSARIIRDVSNAAGSATGSTGITVTGGSFNTTTPTAYDLEYQGTLAADAAAGVELTGASATPYVRSLTLSVTGDVTVPPDGVIEYYITVGSSLSFGGTLTINNLSGLKISGGSTLTMSATGVTHTIKGELATAAGTDFVKLTGANVTLAGSTAKADPAKVGNIQLGSGTVANTIAINNVQNFSGVVTANAFSTVTLGMGSTDNTAALLPSEQQIAGLLTLSGTSFTLGSNVEGLAGVSFTGGSLNYGAYNLKVSGGNYAQSTGISQTSTGGALVMNSAAGTITLTAVAAEAVPNLTVLKNATMITSNGYVSGKLVIGDASAAIPTLTLTGVNLLYTGNAITLVDDATGGSAVAGTGTLVVTGTNVTATASADYSFANLQFNPTNGVGTLTFATDDTTLTNTRVFTVTNILTHSAGVLALGVNDLKLTGTGTGLTTAAYIRTVAGGGTFTSDGGYLEFGGAAAQYFTGGTGWSVPYLRINNASGVSNLNTTTAFTVAVSLDLKDGTFTTGAASTNLLTMADGSTIIREGTQAGGNGKLDQKPTFSGKVNLSYKFSGTPAANQTVDVEMPTSTTALNNLTISNTTPTGGPYTGQLILIKAITVNGTLKLSAGELQNTTFGVNITSGGALEMNGGSIAAAPTAPSYALIYSAGGAVTSTDTEFPDVDVATITSLTIKNKSTNVSTVLTLHASRTIGSLTLNSFAGTTGGIELAGKTLTATGNVTITKGNFTNGGTQVAFVLAGTTLQAITVPAAGWTIPASVDLRLNNAAGFTLTGGNLNMSYAGGVRTVAGNTIYFVNGVLSTGANSVMLAQTTLGQGFDRSGVVGTNVSHINGKVRHSIPGGAGGATYVNGRFEFPVGTATLYRPFALTFSSTYPAINPTNVDVSQVDSSAGGRVGMPINDAGNGVRIGNYPNYYWLVATTPSSFSATQQFDVDLQGTNLGYPFSSAADLRVIRRQDGNAALNPWQLQGAASTTSGQSNYINVGTAGDSTVFVRASSSSGGLVTQGSRFSIGIPTRPPVFTTAPTTGAVDENSTLTQQFTGDPQDVGETIAYSLVTPPAGAAINASTGVLTWKPTYDQAGTYNIVVSITDGQFSLTTTDTVTVVNVNRPPVFSPRTVASTVKDTDTLKVALAATDADANTVTYSFISVTPATTNAPAVSGTSLTWKPTFADAGQTYAILVLASDGVTTGHGPTPGTDTLTVNVTVNRSRARGDVDGNGTIQAADASLVLKHVAGVALLTDPAALFAADASNNGTITAYDAALILQAAAGLVTLPAANDQKTSLEKMVAVAGSLTWTAPEATTDPAVIKVGLKLSDAANVYAAQLTSKADFSAMSVEGVNAALPDGWQIQWSVSGNELRVAMAGATPVSSGDIATLTVRLKNKETRLSFSTDALLNENFQSVGAVEIAAVPTVFALEQNYPNPFNPSTTIKYQIPADANVNLVIYNVQGQQIRTLVAKEQKAGYYNVVWDGRNEAGQTVSSGLYLYRVQAGSFVATHKMLMIK